MTVYRSAGPSTLRMMAATPPEAGLGGRPARFALTTTTQAGPAALTRCLRFSGCRSIGPAGVLDLQVASECYGAILDDVSMGIAKPDCRWRLPPSCGSVAASSDARSHGMDMSTKRDADVAYGLMPPRWLDA